MHMKRLFILLSLVLGFFVSQKTIAQTLLPPSDFEVLMAVAPGDSSNVFGDTLFSSNTRLVGTMVVTLQDTTSVQSINVSMGDTIGGSNLFQKTFLFDNSGIFSDGTSYSRIGLNVYLGIGNYVGLNNFYSQVVLKDSSGNSSVAVFYSPNN